VLLFNGFDSIDYTMVADPETLEELYEVDYPEPRPARLLVAARIGGTRLIDNMAFWEAK
jgi:pantoate--beta-alanine ligase